MTRPNEITLLVLDDIYRCLKKYDYKEIKLSENKNLILVKAKKNYDGHFFDVDIEYNDVTRNVHISVYLLTPVSKDSQNFILKLLNYISFYEEEAKYHLCPENKIISCSTSHSILNCRSSIGELIECQTSCSIENLSDCYYSSINEDIRGLGLNSIRFYNDFWK